MPTIKPRVAVTLDPYTHAVIDRLATLQGRTRGSVISDLLDSVTPALTRTVALLEAAAAAPDEVKRGLRGVVESVHDELLAASGVASEQMDLLVTGGAAGRGNPHVVTRGSGTGESGGSASTKTGSKPLKPRAPAPNAKRQAK